MIDQNIQNICQLIKQALARVSRSMSLSDIQRIQLTLAFTFLRRIDCLVGEYAKESNSFYSKNKEKLSDEQLDKKLKEISGGYNFYNVSGYNFNELLNSDSSVEVALNSYLQGFCFDISDFLSDMDFEQNIAILQRQSKYIVDLFEFFSNLDLSISAIDDKQYIDIISTLASDGSRHNVLCPTPVGLSKLICECLFCKEVCEGLLYSDPLEEISIYDPACGIGSLLAYAGEKAKAVFHEDVYLIGKEISTFSCAIASALILLTGEEYSYADNVNTLTKDDSDGREYKFVVGDLPLGLPWTPFKERVMVENMKGNGRFSKGLPSTGDSQFLFIQDIVSKMDSVGGRAAFVTSGSVLRGGTVKSGESRIRRWLFESGLVETIIALPAGILSPYTNIPVFLWILSSNENTSCNKFCEKMDGKVRLIDATKLVSSNNKFKIDDTFIESVLREYKSLKNTSATHIVNKEDFGFYEVNLKEGSKKETVRISLNTSIHEFIEKERKPYAKGEIVIEFSSVEKGYTVDFNKFFKTEDVQLSSLEVENKKMLLTMEAISSLAKDVKKISSIIVDTPFSNFWKEIPLRVVIDFVPSNSKSDEEDLVGLPILPLAYYKGESLDVEINDGTNKYKRIKLDDVIFVKSGASAGEVFKPIHEMISPSLEAIRCTNESILLPGYLYYLLKGYEKSFKSLAKGASIKSVSAKSILDYKCLIPSIEEQRKITRFLDFVVGKIDNIIKSMESSNNVFADYRQTLIENAVRGKLNIL